LEKVTVDEQVLENVDSENSSEKPPWGGQITPLAANRGGLIKTRTTCDKAGRGRQERKESGGDETAKQGRGT